MIRLALLALLAAAPPAFAQNIRFSPDATAECIDSGNPEGDCIGASANLCMERTEGGFSTAGMNACLDRELGYWDTRLNAAYGPLMARHRREDADMGMPEDQRLATPCAGCSAPGSPTATPPAPMNAPSGRAARGAGPRPCRA